MFIFNYLFGGLSSARSGIYASISQSFIASFSSGELSVLCYGKQGLSLHTDSSVPNISQYENSYLLFVHHNIANKFRVCLRFWKKQLSIYCKNVVDFLFSYFPLMQLLSYWALRICHKFLILLIIKVWPGWNILSRLWFDSVYINTLSSDFIHSFVGVVF